MENWKKLHMEIWNFSTLYVCGLEILSIENVTPRAVFPCQTGCWVNTTDPIGGIRAFNWLTFKNKILYESWRLPTSFFISNIVLAIFCKDLSFFRFIGGICVCRLFGTRKIPPSWFGFLKNRIFFSLKCCTILVKSVHWLLGHPLCERLPSVQKTNEKCKQPHITVNFSATIVLSQVDTGRLGPPLANEKNSPTNKKTLWNYYILDIEKLLKCWILSMNSPLEIFEVLCIFWKYLLNFLSSLLRKV